MQVIHEVFYKAETGTLVSINLSLSWTLLFLISVTVKFIYLMNIILCYIFLHLL